MRLHVFAFGKLKTPGLRATADYYSRLIQPWAPLQEIELKPLTVPDKSAATRSVIQEKESDTLLNKISSSTGSRNVIYLLDETGKSMRTTDWSKLIQSWDDQSFPEVSLCIGSSLGFSESLRKKARGLLSLGPQTTSHELARVILLEQIYRALSVIKGHPYHNEGS